MSFDVNDLIDRNAISNCCGAAIMLGDMCADCGEHCTDERDNEEEETLPEDYDPTPYCSYCKAKSAAFCNCPPTASNE